MLSPSTGTAWIVVCGWNGKWQYSSNCGDMKCLADATGVAHCWNPGKEWDSNPFSVPRRELQDAVTSALDGVCQAGLFACSYDPATNTAWIIVCDANQTWQYLRSCGQNQKCNVVPPGSGNVLCTPLEAVRSLDLVTRQDPTTCTHPGEVACNDHTVVRCDNGHWTEIENCGPDPVCAIDEGRIPRCIPPMGIAASTLATVVVGAAASAKA